MQAVNAFWSFGATVGPFLVSLFLVPLPDIDDHLEHWNSTHAVSQNDIFGSFPAMTVSDLLTNTDIDLQSNTSATLTPTTETVPDNIDVNALSLVRFAYLVTAGLVIFAPIAFTVLFVRKGASCKSLPHKNGENNATGETSNENTTQGNRRITKNEKSRRFTLTLTALLLCLCLLFMFMEVTTAYVIASYVIKVLGWSNSHGALATSVYFGAHTTARVLAIMSSAFVPAKYLIIVDSILILAGYVTMSFAQFHDMVMWVASALIGLGLGTCFPCVILMASSYFHISGKVAALFVVSTGLAALTGPWCITFLMEEVHPNSFVYAGLTCSLLACVVLVGTRLCIRKYANTIPGTGCEQEKKMRENNDDATPEVIPLTSMDNVA